MLSLFSSKSVNDAFGNSSGDQVFALDPGSSRSFFWRLKVPDDQGPITYTAIGATDKLSDGESGMLPILSKRVLVQESIPLPVRGAQTKTFDFAKLRGGRRGQKQLSEAIAMDAANRVMTRKALDMIKSIATGGYKPPEEAGEASAQDDGGQEMVRETD